LFNLLEPSSSTHFLQIYYTGLIGPTSHTFWAWTVNRDPTWLILWKIFLKKLIHCHIFGC